MSREIYQEGLVIPPVRFVKDGEIDRDLFAMIRSNVRGTREISGDFRAQTAANRLGAQRIEALVAQYGAATLAHYLDELLRYTERRTRAAFAEFPDGRFAADMLMDGDGVTDQPVKLAADGHDRAGPRCPSTSPAATTSASRPRTRRRRRRTRAWRTC